MSTRPVCARCGSPDIAADAAARWNEDAGNWEVANVFDDGHSCDHCECEVEIEWVVDDTPDSVEVSAPSPTTT